VADDSFAQEQLTCGSRSFPQPRRSPFCTDEVASAQYPAFFGAGAHWSSVRRRQFMDGAAGLARLVSFLRLRLRTVALTQVGWRARVRAATGRALALENQGYLCCHGRNRLGFQVGERPSFNRLFIDVIVWCLSCASA